MTSENKGMLLGLITVFLFGLTLPATRFIANDLNPIFIGLGRAVVAAIVAIFILFITQQNLPNKKQVVQLMFIGMGVILGFPVLTAYAMQTVPASHGGVVLALLPLATALAGTFIAHERPSIGFWLASLLGSILVLVFSLYDSEGSLLWGDFILLLAVISAAIGYALGAQLAKQIGGWQVICWALVIALPFIIIPAYLYAPSNFDKLTPLIWLNFFYLALVSQLFGFFVWYKALALGGIARVSQIQLIQPFYTIIVASFLLGEALSIMTIGFTLSVISIVYLGKKMPIYKL